MSNGIPSITENKNNKQLPTPNFWGVPAYLDSIESISIIADDTFRQMIEPFEQQTLPEPSPLPSLSVNPTPSPAAPDATASQSSRYQPIFKERVSYVYCQGNPGTHKNIIQVIDTKRKSIRKTTPQQFLTEKIKIEGSDKFFRAAHSHIHLSGEPCKGKISAKKDSTLCMPGDYIIATRKSDSKLIFGQATARATGQAEFFYAPIKQANGQDKKTKNLQTLGAVVFRTEQKESLDQFFGNETLPVPDFVSEEHRDLVIRYRDLLIQHKAESSQNPPHPRSFPL